MQVMANCLMVLPSLWNMHKITGSESNDPGKYFEDRKGESELDLCKYLSDLNLYNPGARFS